MDFDSKIEVKKLPQSKVECTVSFTEDQVAPAEKIALEKLGKDIKLEGFRPGKATPDMLRDKVDPQKLIEEIIHALLPDTIEKVLKEHEIRPIISPHVEAISKFPLTLKITFVEKPDVKLKGIDKIKVERKETKVDEKEVQKMIDYILKQHQKTKEVDTAAKEGDQITMDFRGEDESGKEIEEIRSTDYQVVIGSATLLPGFEDNLKNMKKGEEKEFTLKFPEKYHAEDLQNKPVKFHVTVKKVEEVEMPELTDEFAKKELNAESVDDLKNKIKDSMKMQEESVESRRREQTLLDEIGSKVQVDLAQELIEEEARMMLEELGNQLAQQNLTIAQWLEQTKKKPEEVQKDMMERGEKRLTVRLGMQQLVEDKNVEITDEEMEQAVEALFANASKEDSEKLRPAYAKGQRAYEQLKWQKKVEKVIDEMLAT